MKRLHHQERNKNLSKNKFLYTEKDSPVRDFAPIRVFNCETFSLNKNALLDCLLPHYENLPWDEYDSKNEQIYFLSHHFPHKRKELIKFLKEYYLDDKKISELKPLIKQLEKQDREEFYKISPYRKRAIAKLKAYQSHGKWELKRLKTGVFRQKKNLFNPQGRVFEECSLEITESKEFKKLFKELCQLIKSFDPQVKEIIAYFHQTYLFAKAERLGSNAPEGIHQDGADYIMSAFILEKFNITGAKSKIYDALGTKPFFQKTLRPGEGIFQVDKDSPLWHDVSPIKVKDPLKGFGFRKSIGFDFHVKK